MCQNLKMKVKKISCSSRVASCELIPCYRSENISFKHGSCIRCVLRKSREIDEIGEVKVTGYAVTTVVEVIEGDDVHKTKQGIRYRHTKALKDSQQDFFS